MMKRMVFIMVISVFAAAPLLADPIDYTHGLVSYGGIGNYTRIGGYYSGNGGEFTLYDYTSGSLLLSNDAYASTTKGKYGSHTESFQTFCLEEDEYTHHPANVFVSLSYVDGSVPGSHAWRGGNNTNLGDDLDARTAYLYYQFAKGTLSNYIYIAGSGRSASAGALQDAIWWIEGEGGSMPGGQAGDWIDEAANAVNTGAWSGIGNVRVLQMVYENTTDGLGVYRQDYLYVAPVPAPAAVLLGMFGLAVAGAKLRKFA
jgi:hypothetical protein